MAVKQRLIDNTELNTAVGYKIRYNPRGVAKDLFHDHDEEILMAGPAGTGKSLACLHKLHLVLSKYPNAKAFMSRKTRSSMTNSCLETFQRHVLKPPDKVNFHKTDQQFNYPNGSMMAVIGLDDPERIKSTDWDMGYIQEATECTENDWEICTTRLRNWVVPYQQLLGDCNPDKPTHWLKRRCDKGLTKMLLSWHQDNPRLWDAVHQKWTKEGEAYLGKLNRLTGARKARLAQGKWVAAEGLVYEQWDQQTHMMTMVEFEDLHPDWTEWNHYWSIDWGHIHPFVWQDWVEDPKTGVLYRVQEIYWTKKLVEDCARYIKELTYSRYIPQAIICDHDAEDRAVFERHTQYLTLAAYKSIQPGIQAVTKRLDPNWNGTGHPGLILLRDVNIEIDPDLEEAGLPTRTEDELDGYVWDEKLSRIVNSKKDELPIDKDNHGCDSSRYMVAFIDNLADDPEDVEGLMMLGDEDQVRISPY